LKIALFLAAMLFGASALAQDKAPERKKAQKKAEKKVQATHRKPTPEQIRKFNDLEKKQQK
jgi:hypothetical protein